MLKVAITTVNFNGKEDTLDWLASLKKLDTKGLETKIFVVSNEKFESKSPSFELIFNPKNQGSAGGYNTVARAALAWRADYILLTNNDTVVNDKNLLTELVDTARSDKTIGAVSPKMYFAPGFEFYKKKYSKSDIGKVIWYAGGHFDWNNINSVHRGIDEVDSGKYNAVEETGFVSGSCMLVNGEIFSSGVFWDENLFAYFYDNDFQEKIRRAGSKLYYNGKTSIYHKVSRTSGIASPISDYYITRNRLIFSMRYAALRTKIAVFRQELSWLFTGRPAQKRGVIDFLTCHRGEIPQDLIIG